MYIQKNFQNLNRYHTKIIFKVPSNNQLPDNDLIVYISLILVFYTFFKLLVSSEEKIVNTLNLLRSLFGKISLYKFLIFQFFLSF